MRWKVKDSPEKQQHQQTISSTNSISFLTNDNLTFKHFSNGGTLSVVGGQDYSDMMKSLNNDGSPIQSTKATSSMPRKKGGGKKRASNSDTINEDDMNYHGSVWTTHSMNQMLNNTDGTNLDFQYMTPSPTTTITATTTSSSDNNNNNSSTNGKNLIANSSAIKLLEEEDPPSKQSKCSAFRSIIFCLCLNFSYANVMRFPREFHKYGLVFLIPYCVLLLVIGLPMVLFEMSIGQFLGQGSAHSWRASPFFKGASLVGRISSWLITIFTSLQSAIALLYVGYLIFEDVPFKSCSNPYSQNTKSAKSGQECIKLTFLTPILKNAVFFGLLTMALFVLWITAMVCTHSGKVLRRAIYFFGILGLTLLLLETGWDIAKSIDTNNMPDFGDTFYDHLSDSTIWFSALVQVIFNLQIGIGTLPVLTGKYLYKGDAVKTSFVYVAFNLIVTLVSVTFFIFQFANPFKNAEIIFPELTTLTTVYDKAQVEKDQVLSRVVPALTYCVAIISAIVTISVNTYSSSRFTRKHRNYLLGLLSLFFSVAALICPDYIVPRLLDARFVGAFIICAMTIEIIGIVWVYGVSNIYTDLEFSIGRPIFKFWLFIWIITPIMLSGLLIWWMITYVANELLIDWVPRWLPILISMGIIVIMACIEVSKQVDYNFFSMIRGATKPSKDWGPADPLVRHAWKQWTSKCEDTGERDFTLRRRGTKDYTNSIKRGQYPHTKYGTQTRNTSTQGSNSPNYSGSVFGDSAIEEDMSVDKFANYRPNHNLRQIYPSNFENKSPKYSKGNPRGSVEEGAAALEGDQHGFSGYLHQNMADDKFSENPLTRKVSAEGGGSYTSRIEIMPQDNPNYKISVVRNPMARVLEPSSNTFVPNYSNFNQNSSKSNSNNNISLKRDSFNSNDTHQQHPDHICWRKYSADSAEYSTEL